LLQRLLDFFYLTVHSSQSNDSKTKIQKLKSHRKRKIKKEIKIEIRPWRGIEIYSITRELMTVVNMERNRNFLLILRSSRGVALKINVEDLSWLWHKRLDHVNFERLKLMSRK
jgi:GAG-pre-integrase domain